MRLLFLLLCLLAMPVEAQPLPAAATPPLHVIPFELYDNRIYVEVAGPGFGPARFLVDNGAQRTHYTLELVRRARLPTGGAVGITGTGPGRIQGAHVRPATLRIGSLSLAVDRGIAVPAEETFGAVYQGTGRRFDGVIGYDLFARYAVEIDYAARALRLYRPGAAAAGAVPIRLIERKPYLDAVLEIGGASLNAALHLDTGFGGALSLNGRFVEERQLLARAGRTLPAWSRGVGGIGEDRLARLGAVRIGGLMLRAPIASLALAQGAGVRSDSAGRVGGEILRRFTLRLDYTARTLAVVPTGALEEPFEADMSGLSLIREDEAILVWRVAPDTPAAAAGVHEGDRLLAIDGTPVSALTLPEIRERLRGDGSQRRLNLVRDGAAVEAVLRLRRRL